MALWTTICSWFLAGAGWFWNTVTQPTGHNSTLGLLLVHGHLGQSMLGALCGRPAHAKFEHAGGLQNPGLEQLLNCRFEVVFVCFCRL